MAGLPASAPSNENDANEVIKLSVAEDADEEDAVDVGGVFSAGSVSSGAATSST